MLEELLFVAPKAGGFDEARQNHGNDEGFIDLVHDLQKKFFVLDVGHAIFDETLPSAGVVALRHIAGGGLIAQTLTRSNEPLKKFDETGCIGRLTLRVDGVHIVASVQFPDHAGGQGLSVVAGARPGRCILAASKAGGRQRLFDEHRKASLDALLHADGGHEFVAISDAGDGLSHVGHFPQLGGPPLAEVEDHVLGGDVDRLHHGDAVQRILPEPITDRAVVLVVLDAADNAVAFLFGVQLVAVQFVHLEDLQLKRHHASVGVSLHKEDAAVDFLSAHGHSQHLVETLGAGYVAVLLFAPEFPEPLDLAGGVLIVHVGLENIATADCVSNERTDHGVHHVRVSFEVSCSCPDGVPAVSVGNLCALIRCVPAGVEPTVVSGIVVPDLVHVLPPDLAPCAPLRADPADDVVKPSHPGHLPSKNAT